MVEQGAPRLEAAHSVAIAPPETVPQISMSQPPGPAIATLLLAHGAGAPMDSPFMEKMTALLIERNVAVCRFEFPYMAARRTTGRRPPAPKAETLMSAYAELVARVAPHGPLYIGGKSMGGRIASMLVGALYAENRVAGAVCLGYPFHPTAKPENVRTAHLESLTAPVLIIQGERDPFGKKSEVAGYALSKSVQLVWLPDGDHDFGPRGASGHTRAQNLARAADAIATFVSDQPAPERA